MLAKLGRKSPLKKVIDRKGGLAKTIGFLSLLFYSISFSFGAGSYSLIGYAAQYAGPAIPFSFIIVGIFCFFIGLPFIEFSTSIPSSGFSYTFVQMSWGEFMGFLCGFLITFSSTFSVSLIARSLAITLVSNFKSMGIIIPKFIYSIKIFKNLDICLMPIILVIPLIIIIKRGIRDSTIFNIIVAFFNLTGLLFGCISGLYFIDWNLYDNFFNKGISGIFKACGLAFFAFSGFENTTSLSEETINLKRDMPKTIVTIIILLTLVNCIISFNMIGMAPLYILNDEKSLLTVFEYTGNGFCIFVISIGMITSLLSAMFGNIIAQVRIYYSMALDGLIPSHFARLNEAKAQYFAANVTCVISLVVSIIFGVEILGNAISISALYSSSFVVLGLILYRHKDSEKIWNIGIASFAFAIISTILGFSIQLRWNFFIQILLIVIIVFIYFYLYLFPMNVSQDTNFKCPCVPLFPLIGACGFSICAGAVSIDAWLLFGFILIMGIICYFIYGYSHSKVELEESNIEKELNLIK